MARLPGRRFARKEDPKVVHSFAFRAAPAQGVLEQPTELRDLALRYRRIASAMADPDTIKALNAKAREFEDQARRIERRGGRNAH